MNTTTHPGTRGFPKKPKPLVIPYRPHNDQRQLHECLSRFVVVLAGRRWGKTKFVSAELLRRVLRKDYSPLDKIAIIAPNYSTADRSYDVFREFVGQSEYFTFYDTKPKKIVCHLTGNTIDFLSADHPDAIRGLGLSVCILDEADYIQSSTFYDVIRPALTDKKGQCIMISTPNIKGSYFHKMFLQGQQENDDDVTSFHFPSISNPYLEDSEVMAAKRALPEISYRREYLAEYIDSGSEVFTGTNECRVDCRCDHIDSLSMGIDLAKSRDFTVITTICTTCNRVKDIFRTNKITWDSQKNFIVEIYNKYKQQGYCQIDVLVDSTGVGDPLLDELRGSCGMAANGYKFSNQSKNNLITNLKAKISTQSITWPKDIENVDIMESELEGYIAELSKSGLITYRNGGTPNDDCVISLGLAVSNLNAFLKPRTNIKALDDMAKEEYAEDLDNIIWEGMDELNIDY